MKVQISDKVNPGLRVVVEESEVESVLKGVFSDELDTEMTPGVDVSYRVQDAIADLQRAISTRSYEQYPLAKALGLEIFSA